MKVIYIIFIFTCLISCNSKEENHVDSSEINYESRFKSFSTEIEMQSYRLNLHRDKTYYFRYENCTVDIDSGKYLIENDSISFTSNYDSLLVVNPKYEKGIFSLTKYKFSILKDTIYLPFKKASGNRNVLIKDLEK